MGKARLGRSYVIVSLVLVMATACNHSEGLQKLAFEKTTIYLGRIPTGAERHCRFPFRNRTGTAIRLFGGRSSCKCMTVNVPPQPIGPGQKGLVSAKFVAPTSPGAYYSDGFLRVQDTDEIIKLTIQADVVARLEMSENVVSFMGTATDSGREKRVLIRFPYDESIAVDDIECSPSFIDAEVLPLNDERNAFQLLIRLRDQASGEPFRGHVRLHTSSQVQRELVLPIMGHLPEKQVATPSTLCFGNVMAGQDKTLPLSLVCGNDSKPCVSVLGRNADSIDFQLRWTEHRKWTLAVRVKTRPIDTGVLQATLLVSQGEAPNEIARIPVLGMVVPAPETL